ncbi:LacI family DNA-binding transcriptional regulator [Nocardioides donggukensis]|uniref:LacI family DNA-binding transcriptional regulator n=1 Tax=Nocardioides donggukensis TaxID=2774019 RepID=A0A927K4K8_9ACTN|nr:LacI family DNA-binding transcriptional regulator [Nocardioides donggukensis]MBD8870384.1 LacI family DNA-binding transcriptional regulator [Nocardioides donggukensis]
MPAVQDVREPHANMADVAARAGVSSATVSRALRGLPGVSPATRDRIRQIAEELSYVVSPEASRLSRRQTGRVAVVVPKIDVWFYSAMLASIEAHLREADLDVLIYQVDGREQRSRFFRELPSRRKVDAVVLIALPVLEDEEERLDLLGVQVVVAGGELRDYPHARVDDQAVAVLAVQHLIELGHRRIAMIRTSDTTGTIWSSYTERTRGYLDALRAADLDVREEYLVTEPFGLRAGTDGVAALLALDEPPTAVFAYSDEIAISALRGLQQRGVRVPEELSVVAVDDHPMAALFDLTTVAQHVPDQGRLAATQVLALVHGTGAAEDSLVVDPHLVIRGTTAPPPDRR